VSEPIVLATEKERVAERDADTEFEDRTVKEWKRLDNESADLLTDSWGVILNWPVDKPDAKPGDRIRVYGGFGRRVRGASLVYADGLVPISYTTKREAEVEAAAWVADHNRKQRAEFERQRPTLDAAYKALPAPLKRRIDRFRAEDPNFRWREEAYEMAAVAEAGRLFARSGDAAWGEAIRAHGIRILTDAARERGVRLYDATDADLTADWPNTPENRLIAFDAINSKPNGYRYQLMDELMPEMDRGHSGNTWGHAMMFALALVRGQGDAL